MTQNTFQIYLQFQNSLILQFNHSFKIHCSWVEKHFIGLCIVILNVPIRYRSIAFFNVLQFMTTFIGLSNSVLYIFVEAIMVNCKFCIFITWDTQIRNLEDKTLKTFLPCYKKLLFRVFPIITQLAIRWGINPLGAILLRVVVIVSVVHY